MKKTVKRKNQQKKTHEKKNPDCRPVNGPAQYRAHAGGAGLGPANGRSIGFALKHTIDLSKTPSEIWPAVSPDSRV
jgi:hypothetical protein